MNVKRRSDGLPANPVLRWLAKDAQRGHMRQAENRLARQGEPDGSPRFDDPVMQALGERFDFTTKDLHENRQGVLSERQIERYRSWGSKTPLNAAKVGAAAGGSFAALFWFSTRDVGAALTIGAVLFGVALLVGIYMRWFLYQRHVRKGKVKSVTGPISHHAGQRGTLATSVHAGRLGLRGRNWVRERGDEALFASVPYVTLYYLQGYATTTVHSIEPAQPPTDSDPTDSQA